ncbi:uncharacterized protein PAC_16429 [Phialocephala subalpina]|uniref:Uncharacterized protein n=1 Tax=Phialocephala subalpina TaxID=576137 RepID=A0A1L7XND0_9HELO|nr:uncharacterized protein PAC_16429 [Phialocephala subalpina]
MAPGRGLKLKTASGRVQKQSNARASPAKGKSASKAHAKPSEGRSIESESADDMMEDTDIDPDHDELQKMTNRFVSMVGKVETFAQVAAASQWMTSMQCTENDIRRFETFNAHAENVGLAAVWPEIIMYRSIGQISTYFLSGQVLRNGGWRGINALDELEISVVGWVRLASEGRLSEMEEFAGVEDGEGHYASHAERFKNFLIKYKNKNRFKVWNHDRMKMLRYKIYKVVHELDGEEEKPMAASGSRQTRLAGAMDAENAFREALDQNTEDSTIRSESIQDEPLSINPSRSSTFDPLYDATPQPGLPDTSAANEQTSNGPKSGALSDTNNARHAASSTDVSDKDDETDRASLVTRLKALEESLKEKNRVYEDAQAAAETARERYEFLDEEILGEVGHIFTEGGSVKEDWTAAVIRAQSRKFVKLSTVLAEELEKELVGPLMAEEEARKSIESTAGEILRLGEKLREAKS